MDHLMMEHSWTESSWIEFINSKSKYQLSVYFCGDKLLGFSLYSINKFDESAHLLKIAVQHNSKRRGIGRNILNSSLANLLELKTKSIFLEVEVENFHAISLYISAGFEKLNKVGKFYSDGASAYRMMRRA
jgi:ribosomal-protein-alanine N-acetyltransferase